MYGEGALASRLQHDVEFGRLAVVLDKACNYASKIELLP